MKPLSNRSAFTLIELLVVIAIIAILAAILFPVFAQAKLAAKKTVDLSNQKQIVLGTLMYENDYDGGYPFCWGVGPDNIDWQWGVNPYIKNTDLWKSPVDNWARPAPTAGSDCTVSGNVGPAITYSMNYMDPWMGNNDYPSDGNWWGAGSTQCLMSPTCDDQSGTESEVPQASSTILVAPRPNWYHEWCSGNATDVFYSESEFLTMVGGGSTMFNNGTNYGFCDGHAKYFTQKGTLTPQGSQAGTSPPTYWPTSDKLYWPWPMGMWDKRQ